MYGDPGLTPLMIVAAVPLFNIYSVLILTFSARMVPDRGSSKSLRQRGKESYHSGHSGGAAFSLLNIELPAILMKTITSVGGTATPIALLMVGRGFQTGALARLRPALWATAIKLVILPLLFPPCGGVDGLCRQ